MKLDGICYPVGPNPGWSSVFLVGIYKYEFQGLSRIAYRLSTPMSWNLEFKFPATLQQKSSQLCELHSPSSFFTSRQVLQKVELCDLLQQLNSFQYRKPTGVSLSDLILLRFRAISFCWLPSAKLGTQRMVPSAAETHYYNAINSLSQLHVTFVPSHILDFVSLTIGSSQDGTVLTLNTCTDDVAWMFELNKLSFKNVLKDLVFDLEIFSACLYKGAAWLTFHKGVILFFNALLAKTPAREQEKDI